MNPGKPECPRRLLQRLVRRLRHLCYRATTHLEGRKDNVWYGGIGDTAAH